MSLEWLDTADTPIEGEDWSFDLTHPFTWQKKVSPGVGSRSAPSGLGQPDIMTTTKDFFQGPAKTVKSSNYRNYRDVSSTYVERRDTPSNNPSQYSGYFFDPVSGELENNLRRPYIDVSKWTDTVNTDPRQSGIPKRTSGARGTQNTNPGPGYPSGPPGDTGGPATCQCHSGSEKPKQPSQSDEDDDRRSNDEPDLPEHGILGGTLGIDSQKTKRQSVSKKALWEAFQAGRESERRLHMDRQAKRRSHKLGGWYFWIRPS